MQVRWILQLIIYLWIWQNSLFVDFTLATERTGTSYTDHEGNSLTFLPESQPSASLVDSPWQRSQVVYEISEKKSPILSGLEKKEEPSRHISSFSNPRREVSIIVTDTGYYPRSVSVFSGESVRFYVTNTLTRPSCMILSDFELFLSAVKGKVTEGEVKFLRPGTHRFYCPGYDYEGRVTVLKKGKRGVASGESRVSRSPAKKIKAYWVPRDQ